MMEMDFERRFGGVRRLYGEAGLSKLQAAHICVIGIGGVGSWAVEALARNAIGNLTLIDLDNIAESNFNRQIHAIDSNVGKAKVTAMRERILNINPLCCVHEIENFITPENIPQLLSFACDGIIDCIDDAKSKTALACFCKEHDIPLIMSGGAGGRIDPTRIRCNDLAYVEGDKLLAKVRNQLRKFHAYPKGNNNAKKAAKMGLSCIYSSEPVKQPMDGNICDTHYPVSGLNCAGYGSSMSVTASFGLVAAQLTIDRIIASKKQ